MFWRLAWLHCYAARAGPFRTGCSFESVFGGREILQKAREGFMPVMVEDSHERLGYEHGSRREINGSACIARSTGLAREMRRSAVGE